jgi:hypothetical protein
MEHGTDGVVRLTSDLHDDLLSTARLKKLNFGIPLAEKDRI